MGCPPSQFFRDHQDYYMFIRESRTKPSFPLLGRRTTEPCRVTEVHVLLVATCTSSDGHIDSMACWGFDSVLKRSQTWLESTKNGHIVIVICIIIIAKFLFITCFATIIIIVFLLLLNVVRFGAPILPTMSLLTFDTSIVSITTSSIIIYTTLPETNMAPTRKPFQKENHLNQFPNFRRCVSFREGIYSHHIAEFTTNLQKPQVKTSVSQTSETSDEGKLVTGLNKRRPVGSASLGMLILGLLKLKCF